MWIANTSTVKGYLLIIDNVIDINIPVNHQQCYDTVQYHRVVWYMDTSVSNAHTVSVFIHSEDGSSISFRNVGKHV